MAGDFPICGVPMLHHDLGRASVAFWGYFAQISDSTTNCGSDSGAVPTEKITWGRLGEQAPRFTLSSLETSDIRRAFPRDSSWLGWSSLYAHSTRSETGGESHPVL